MALSASALIAGISAQALASFQVTEHFDNDTDAYWEHTGNRTAPQNYGWSTAAGLPTDNTGATVKPPGPDGIAGNADDGTASGAGEFGGLIYRPAIPATPTYYGFNVGTINPATEGFNVSGVIRSNRNDGALFLGYFQGAFSFPDDGKNAHDFVGILLNDGKEVFTQVYNPGGSREGGQLAGVNVPTDGTPVPFSMIYSPPPAGSGNGSLTVSVGNASGTTNLPNTIVQSIGDLTHFGLFPQVRDPGPNDSISEIYLDDLTFSSENALPVPSGSVWALNGDGPWFEPSNWTGGVPNASDAKATFGDVITADHLVNIDSPATVGTLTFDNPHMYLLDGVSTLTMQVSTGSALVDVKQGSQKINLPLVIASDTNLKVAAGATLFISDPVTVNSGVSLASTGGGTVTYQSTVNVLDAGNIAFGSSSHLAALSLNGTAKASITPGRGKVLEFDSLSSAGASDAWTSQIDIADNDLIVHSSESGRVSKAAEITNQLKQGANFAHAGEFWTGKGIVSSLGGNGSTTYTAVGVAVNDFALLGGTQTGAIYSTFDGQPVGVNDVLVKYTYFGDADLDGAVTTNDYFQIDNGFLGSKTGWINGDFDYDGAVTTNDYFLIDNAFLGQGAAIVPASAGTASALSGVTAVPEPASLGVFAFAAAAAFRRRRRSRTDRT